MKTLILRGPYYEPNSHGGTVRAMALACHRAGIPVRLDDCPSGLWRNFPLKLKREESEIIKQLEQTPVQPKDYWLVQHVVPNQFVYDSFAFKNVGYVTFETDGLPGSWLVPMQAMDEIWCASFFNIKTFGSAGVNKTTRLVPHGVDLEMFKQDKDEDILFDMRLPKDVVKFGCVFDWTPRKNGLNIIQAFLSCFKDREDVTLVLKVYFKGQDQTKALKDTIADFREQFGAKEFPRICICNKVIPDWYMGAFYQQIDCLISLAYGEGFNKPVLEAMACGVPSIVTGWGGHMDFCNSQNSLWIGDNPIGPVSSEQIKTCGEAYAHQNWAYPNMNDVCNNMAWFAEVRDSEFIRSIKDNCLITAQNFSWEKVAEHIKEIMEDADE